MRRSPRRPEPPGALSISLLDAIACAFGAVILLVIVTPSQSDDEAAAADLVVRTADAERAKTEMRISEASNEHRARTAEAASLRRLAMRAEREAHRLLAEVKSQDALRGRTEGRRSAMRRAEAMLAAAQAARRAPPPQEAAGIPVDSDHVAIVLDTSGSMRPFWGTVMREMSNVLSQYPKLHGFQVLSDQGEYLHQGSEGRWLPDTPERRGEAMRRMRSWRAYSASNPAPGILRAVRDLYAPGMRMAVFVFGDDYQGTQFDALIDRVESGVRRLGATDDLRIHAVGFSNLDSASNAENFAVLMRSLTERHGGAFLALPEQSVPDRVSIRRSGGEPLRRPLD